MGITADSLALDPYLKKGYGVQLHEEACGHQRCGLLAATAAGNILDMFLLQRRGACAALAVSLAAACGTASTILC
jgi:hypothetical protein